MLTSEETTALNSLSEEDQEYVKAKYSTPIHLLSDKDLKDKCLVFVEDAVKSAAAKTGNDKEVITYLHSTLVKDLRRPKCKFYGITEIELAAYKGVRKEYGEFFGVNITAFHSWIDGYMKSKQRLEALNNFVITLKDQQVKTSNKPVQLSVEDSKKGCIDYFNHYKETGKFQFFPFAYYDIIKKLLGVKTLVDDPEVRKEIKRQTEEQFTVKLVTQKVKSEERGQFNDAEAIMSHVASRFEGDNGLINKQKELALKFYFDQLIKEGRGLTF